MTDRTPTQERAAGIVQRLEQISSIGWDLPTHVPYRVAILLGDGDIRYLDTSLRRGGLNQPWRVVALNDKRVVVVEVEAMPDEYTATVPTATARVWSRSALRELRVPTDAPDGGNADNTWTNGGEGWPRGGVADLVYDGIDEPLRLPLTWQGSSELRALLPSLLDDLD
jgi:hypothetical protein